MSTPSLTHEEKVEKLLATIALITAESFNLEILNSSHLDKDVAMSAFALVTQALETIHMVVADND